MAEDFYKRLSRAKRYILVNRSGKIEEVVLMPLKVRKKKKIKKRKK